MSGLAKTYSQIVKKELNAHAAWFPVTNALEVGDYGLIEDGTFRPIGKIAQQYPDIEIKAQPGNQTNIDFKSEGTNAVVTDMQGNAKSFQALGDAEGQLKITMSKANSAMIKASITSSQMTNVADVASRLRKKKDWQHRYKVVSAVYVGENATVFCSREADTELIISGKADILQAVEAGKADVALNVSANKSGVFHSVGKTGVIAIDLFKLKMLGRGVSVLGETDQEQIEMVAGEAEDDVY